MAKFTAGTAVDKLDWDFTDYQPKDEPGTIAENGEAIPPSPWAGTIPEPSQDSLQTYVKAIGAIAPTGDPERLGEVTEFDTAMPALKDAAVQLCGGRPTRAMLDTLPFRVLLAFLGWLSGQLGVVNPQ